MRGKTSRKNQSLQHQNVRLFTLVRSQFLVMPCHAMSTVVHRASGLDTIFAIANIVRPLFFAATNPDEEASAPPDSAAKDDANSGEYEEIDEEAPKKEEKKYGRYFIPFSQHVYLPLQFATDQLDLCIMITL